MTSQQRSDIAIVGASASGLFTALLLAREGCRVSVYERSPTIASVPRTLIVTSAFEDCLGPVGTSSITNEVRRYQLFANGKVGEVELGRPDLIIERATLMRSLASEAVAAGVRLRLGHRFVGLEKRNGKLTLEFALAGSVTEHIDCSILVGADGASSRVARAAGWHRQPTVPLLQAIIESPEDLPPQTSRVWFVPDDTCYFYWLIPEVEGKAALGVIGEDSGEVRGQFDRFMANREMKALSYQGAMIPRYNRWIRLHKKVAGCDVYLVGDAAGQVKVSTVGGLVTGFRGSSAVAEAILGRPSRRSARALRRELDAHLLVRKVMNGFRESDYSRLLDLLNEPTRKSLHRYNRDQATAVLWRIAVNQPRLLSMSMRALLPRNP